MGVNMAIKIYIDQGHNPQSPNAGAEGNGYIEQDITYDVGIILADLLRSNGNFDVRLSRPTPQSSLGTSNSTSLRIRVDEANAFGADYFISLHTNASTNTAVSGSEALVYTEPSVASELGEDILFWLNRITGLKNRGIVERPGLRGQQIQPLYNTIPQAVKEDNELYQLLVIVDTLRMGRVREREIAIAELTKHINGYAEN